MTELKFYTNPMSRGQTIRWMLEEVGDEVCVKQLAGRATWLTATRVRPLDYSALRASGCTGCCRKNKCHSRCIGTVRMCPGDPPAHM